MTTQYWLVKSEPATYSWDDFVRDGRSDWTGVRNYAARLHLNAMRRGDEVMFYHSNDGKCIVGIARVTQPAFPDPTADEPGLPASGGAKGGQGWVAVELAPLAPLPRPVTLAQCKADAVLKNTELLRQSRLSVSPLKPTEFTRIKKLAKHSA